MRRGSLLLNVTTLVGAQAAVKLINLAVSVAVVRYLGAQELGLYAYILAFAYPFGALADFGLATYAIREISRDRTRELELVAILKRALLLLACLWWAAMMGLAVLLSHDTTTLACLALAGVSNFLSAVTTPALVVLTAREDLHLVSLYQISSSMLGSAAIMIALFLGGASLALFIATTVANGAILVLAYVLVGRMPSLPGVPFSAATMMVRQALPFGLLLLGFALYYRVDMVLLQWLRTTREVGLYSAAYRFLDAVIPLAAAMSRPFYPRLSSLTGRDAQGVRDLLETTWRPLVALSLPFALGTCFVAESLTFALFGSGFAEAGPLLQILIWGSIPLFLIMIPTQALMAANLVLRLAGVYGLSVAVNVAANFLLIPRWGASGAAVATVLCEWLNLVLVVIMVRREFAVSIACAGLWRYGLAAGGMVSVLWLTQGTGLVAQIVLGIVAYAAAFLTLGGLRAPEFVALRRLVQ
jgi:O-antigen/teichoic acid export membrane protein